MFPCSCLSLHIRLESLDTYIYISKCSYLVPPYFFLFLLLLLLFIMFTEIKRYVTFAFYRVCIYIYIYSLYITYLLRSLVKCKRKHKMEKRTALETFRSNFIDYPTRILERKSFPFFLRLASENNTSRI